MIMKYRSIIETYLFFLLIALLIYIGLFVEVDGINNIGIASLWVLGVLLAIGVSDDERKFTQISIYDRIIRRSVFSLIILTMIYKGSIVLGLVYLYYFAAKIIKQMREIEVDEATN